MTSTAKPNKGPTLPYCDIEIFAGAGGLTLGLQRAGFEFSHVFEVDPHTCETLRTNHSSNGGLLQGEVCEADVASLDWNEFNVPVRLLAGGAPCQPFSLAGRHLADRDDRNMFPEVFRAVRALRPRAVLLENVQGLARPSFRPYFHYILRQLEWPSIRPKREEPWQDHLERISQHQEATTDALEYHASWALLEAADYGVAQTRRRVFLVATRSDLSGKFTFPSGTHKKDVLIRQQRSGEYWKNRRLEPPSTTPDRAAASDLGASPPYHPWKTVRDAISDLPCPAAQESKSDNNHWLIPGARLYRGHSGSRLDWPSKTIKAGVHGVPGGENIVLLDDGTHRYFTLRETARIQGFPDEFLFRGARLHVTRQIGNAVPIDLAEAIGRRLLRQITKSNDTIGPSGRSDNDCRDIAHD